MRFAASASVELRRNQITGIADCCARAVNGQAEAAQPTNAMNSRRLIASPLARDYGTKRISHIGSRIVPFVTAKRAVAMSALGHKRTWSAPICDVRFTLNSGHSLRQSECPLWAKSGSRLRMPAQLWELWFATLQLLRGSSSPISFCRERTPPAATSAAPENVCPSTVVTTNAVALVLEIRDHGISHKFAYSGSPARRSPSSYRAIFSACR
jgi:hypothetical protein